MATTLAEYVTALEQTWTGLVSVVSDLTEAEWDTPTELPGWSVKDNVSHIVGVELFLMGEPFPDHVVSDLPHVRNDAGRWVEVPVDLRRPSPGAAVLAELREVTDRRLKELRALDEAALDTVVTGVLGFQQPLKHLLGLRVFDSWAHEQDVRRALGRPGGLSSDAAWLTRRRLLLAMSGLPVAAGRTAAFVLSDPASEATLTFGASYVDGAAPDADVTLAMPYETFVRLGMGRAHWPDVSGVTVTGDAALGDEVLRQLAITP
jgi:uncharacterized protein (TIGR03083 family)